MNPANQSNTHQQGARSLLDHWLWEPPMLKAFVKFAIAVPVLSALLLLPFLGQFRTWFAAGPRALQ